MLKYSSFGILNELNDYCINSLNKLFLNRYNYNSCNNRSEKLLVQIA